MWGIDFDKMINDLLDDYARRPKRVARIKAAVNQIKALYTSFWAWKDDALAKIQHNGQTIYLEKRLNDKWDPINRGIYINSNIAPDLYYLFRKSESVSPVYLYRKWSSTHPYLVGEYCMLNNVIYQCFIANTGQSPHTSPSKWVSIGTVQFIRRKPEFYGLYNFIVNVPNAVVFNSDEMKALINYYKQAGKQYIIQLY